MALKRIPVSNSTAIVVSEKTHRVTVEDGGKRTLLTTEQSAVFMAAIGTPKDAAATIKRGYVDVPVGQRGRKAAPRTTLGSLATAAKG